ncbi:Chaperone protein DnaJ [Ceratocystis lukuohia]
MSSSSGALSILGWWFLPSMVSGWIQSLWYTLTIRAGSPHPAPGSPRHTLHRRIIQALVISTYLLYTILEADYEISRTGNFYTALGVTPTASDREIKSRFRRLAAIHHPDKSSVGPTDGPGSADFFIMLKTAVDTLTDPAKRFAYDRFGAGVHEWKHCTTVYDYLQRGAMDRLVPHYLGAAMLLYILGFFGLMENGRFWRWLLMAMMSVAEITLLTRPTLPRIFANVMNPMLALVAGRAPYVQFQVIALLRRLSITVAIALAQLGPVLFPNDGSTSKAEVALAQGLGRLEGVAGGLDKEITAVMNVEFAPFKDDTSMITALKGQIKDWLVQNTIRSDPMVVDAMGTSLRRRRPDAPHGARGTM